MSPNTEHVFVLTYSSGAGAAWGMTVGDPLFAYGPDAQWLREKSMADSYTFSADGTEITVKLKQGVKFHDGTDFNAEAMKFSLDWVLDPKNAVSTRPSIESISSVEVKDANTLVLRTKTLYAPIITNLGMTAAMPVSPTAFKTIGVDGMKSKGGPSTGPFRVKEWVPGAQIVFEKHPQYHQKGRPYVDSWVWVEVPDDRVRAAAMQAGQLDMIATGSGAVDSIKAMRDAKMLEFKLYEGPRLAHFNAARAPFNDLRVRQAAQMAIDRYAWNKVLNGGEGYVYRGSALPPGHAMSYEVEEKDFPYPYNPTKARALLEEYAKEKGLTLPLTMMGAFTCTAEQKARGCYDLVEQPIKASTTAAREDAKDAEFALAYLEAVGFKPVLEIGAGREADRTFVTKELSFSFRGFGVRPHPSGSFDSYLGYGGYWNNGGWGTSPEQMEMDRLVRAASQTYDFAEQTKLYKAAQKIYLEAALGGVKTANRPTYHFAQPWVRWAGYPDTKWIKYPSDVSLHMHDVWLEKR
jgi:ABC-type transport system substrate-binding protein